MFKFKWLSENDNGAGGAASGTPTSQGNAGGNGGQGAPDPRIKELSDESAAWRNKHKQAAEEATKLKADLDAATSKLTASEVQYGVEKALIRAALRAKFVDPDDVLKFVDVATIAQLLPDKRAAAITEALDKLAADKPHFVQSAAAQGTDAKKPGASPANPAEAKTTLTLDEIKGMSREQLAARKDEVFRALKDK